MPDRRPAHHQVCRSTSALRSRLRCCRSAIGIAALLVTVALPSALLPGPALAQATPLACELYAVEDTSSGSQRRARLYVATPDPRPEAALALGYDATVTAAMNHGYAYVDVFVTRTQDGLDPEEHSAGTAIAWVRFNPGGTPVIDGRMEGQVVTDTRGDPEYGLLAAERREVAGYEINEAWLELVGTGENHCGV